MCIRVIEGKKRPTLINLRYKKATFQRPAFLLYIIRFNNRPSKHMYCIEYRHLKCQAPGALFNFGSK
jgi:hypothetical protein